MATSGTVTYNQTAIEIVEDALANLNINAPIDQLSEADRAYCFRALNRLVKNQQAAGSNLWKKKTATLFLQKDQSEYHIDGSTAHCALSPANTTLSADEVAGQLLLSVVSSAGMTIGDFIGIELDTNYLQWSTIFAIPGPTYVQIVNPLTSLASSGAHIYTYTNKITNPFDIFSAVRHEESDRDVSMNPLSYEEYFRLPTKTSTSIPVSYSYDRQLNDAVIRVWPVPDKVDVYMKLTLALKIEDFVSNPNDPDFQQEWLEALVGLLSVKIAPAFGKHKDQGFVVIKNEAQEAYIRALNFDCEHTSIYLQPNEYW